MERWPWQVGRSSIFGGAIAQDHQILEDAGRKTVNTGGMKAWLMQAQHQLPPHQLKSELQWGIRAWGGHTTKLEFLSEPSAMRLLAVDTQICWMSGMLAPLWLMPAFLVYPLQSLTLPPKAGLTTNVSHLTSSGSSHQLLRCSSHLPDHLCPKGYFQLSVSLLNLSPRGSFTFLVPSLDNFLALAWHVHTPHTVCVHFRLNLHPVA